MAAIRTTHLPLKQAGPYFVKFLHDRLVANPMSFEACAGKIRRDVASPSHPPLAHVPPPAPDLYIQRAAIEANAFNSMPSGTPVLMSFSGLAVNFRACYNGFTIDLGSEFPEDRRFALERGFDMTYNIKPPGGWASAADGSGDKP